MAEQGIIFRMTAIAHSNHMENYKNYVIKKKQKNKLSQTQSWQKLQL